MQISANYKNANALLNQVVNRVGGPELSFEIYFWGANPLHSLNREYKHASFWVGYILSGQGHYIEETFTAPLSPGTIFCSRPDVWRKIQSERGLSILFVSFDILEEDSPATSLVESFRRLRNAKSLILPNAGSSPAAKIWDALWIQAEQYQQPYTSVLSGMAYSLLLSFAQLFDESRLPEPENVILRRRMSSMIIKQAKWFIADNYSLPLKLEEIARHLHISGRHLSRLFMEEVGLSFTDYMRHYRIDQAISALLGTDKPVGQIADECGFGSVYYFTRVFVSATGLPPGQYRKMHAKL